MAEVEPFEYMFDQTTRLIRTAGGLSDEYFGGFTPDSLAAAACDESELGSATLNAYMVGASQIGAALDFVSGMVHLCRPSVHRYTVFAAGRAAVEASSRAWWLLDENLTREERARRAMKERCRGLRERVRLEKAMGLSTVPALRRIVVVRKRSRSLGVVGRIGFPPAATDLLRRAFLAAGLSLDEGGLVMKQLSGYVHVAPWAILAQLQPVASDEGEAERDSRTTLHTPSIRPSELAYTIDSVVRVFILAFSAQVASFGWDVERWTSESSRVKRDLRRAVVHILKSES